MLFEGSSLAARSGEITRTIVEGLFNSQGRPPSLKYELITGRLAILGVLLVFFAGAVLLMVPITWVYMYTHPFSYRRTFITALIILPICATATVWLIHDSLALAFGLAALVAAVRFRIRLEDPLDGVYVFSSISVGLSSGTGQLLVGYVMACFFCFGATIMWITAMASARKPKSTTRPPTRGRSLPAMRFSYPGSDHRSATSPIFATRSTDRNRADRLTRSGPRYPSRASSNRLSRAGLSSRNRCRDASTRRLFSQRPR